MRLVLFLQNGAYSGDLFMEVWWYHVMECYLNVKVEEMMARSSHLRKYTHWMNEGMNGKRNNETATTAVLWRLERMHKTYI